MNSLIAAISLGFLGSFHCVGMCGPIALALPVNGNSAARKFTAILLYNIGRALTYGSFGVLFGSIGRGFAIFGLQQVLSVVMGGLILLSVVLPSSFTQKFKITQTLSKPFNALKLNMAGLFSKRSLPSFLGIGMLNGLLPCGFVYIAVAGAVAAGSAFDGTLFMVLFGMGTFPAMMSLSWFAGMIGARARSTLRAASPYIISFIAVLMILRGMNLGVPYLSPKMVADTQAGCHSKKIMCCHK